MLELPPLQRLRTSLASAPSVGDLCDAALELSELLATSNDPLLQRGAAQVAGALGAAAEPAVAALVDVLRTNGAKLYGPVYPVTLAAAEALEQLGPALDLPCPLDILLAGAGPDDGDAESMAVAWQAARACAQRPGIARDVQPGRDPYRSAQRLSCMARLGLETTLSKPIDVERATSALALLVEREQEKAREAAVCLLGVIGRPAHAARDAVRRCLQGGYTRLRWVAALALQRLEPGTTEGTDLIAQAAAGGNGSVNDITLALLSADALLLAGQSEAPALAAINRYLANGRFRARAAELLALWDRPIVSAANELPSAPPGASNDGARLGWAEPLLRSSDPRTRARGELVSVECEIARLAAQDSERLTQLLRREDELLRAHGAAWIAAELPSPIVTGRSASSFEYRRGFVEAAYLGGRPIEALALEGLVAAGVRQVAASLAEGELGKLQPATRDSLTAMEHLAAVADLIPFAELGHLNHLGLTLRASVGRAWRLLAQGLPSLRSLKLRIEPGFGDLAGLCESELGRRLERLDLWLHGNVDPACLAPVHHLSSLRHLQLAVVGAAAPVLEQLQGSPLLEHLEGLTVNGLAVDDSALMLGIVRGHPNLAELRLGVVHHGPGAFRVLLEALARAPRRALELRAMGLGPPEVQALVELWPVGLIELDLTANAIGAEGATTLARSSAVRGLRTLRLGSTQIGMAGAEELARSPYLESLRRLDLGETAPSSVVRERFRHALVEERPGKFREPWPW